MHESNMQRRCVRWLVRPRTDELFEQRRPVVRFERSMDDARAVHGRLHEWRLHRVLLSGLAPMFGQRRGDLFAPRNVGSSRRVHGTDVCERRLLGRVRLEPDPVPWERRRDVRHDRPMGNAGALHQPNVPHGLVHGCVRAESNPMQRQYSADVQRKRYLDERGCMHESDMRERSVCRRVLAGPDAVPRQLDSIVQRNGHMADPGHVLRSYAGLPGEQLRRMQSRTDAMLR